MFCLAPAVVLAWRRRELQEAEGGAERKWGTFVYFASAAMIGGRPVLQGSARRKPRRNPKHGSHQLTTRLTLFQPRLPDWID